MNFEQICNALRSRFKTLVADVENLPTYYDNQEADPTALANTMHCVFEIDFGESFQVSLDGLSKRFRTPGIAVAELRGPKARGDKEILALADKIADSFRSVSLVGGLTLKTPTIRRDGSRGGHYVVVVSAPFYSDRLVNS